MHLCMTAAENTYNLEPNSKIAWCPSNCRRHQHKHYLTMVVVLIVVTLWQFVACTSASASPSSDESSSQEGHSGWLDFTHES